MQNINPSQAGVFWNHTGWGHNVPPLFLLYLWSNYNQAWHDGTLGQNLPKAIKILLTSSLGRHEAIFGIVPGQNSSFLIFWS